MPNAEEIRQRIAETKKGDPKTIAASQIGVKARLEKYGGTSWNKDLPKEQQPRFGKPVSPKQIEAMRKTGKARQGSHSWNQNLSEWSPPADRISQAKAMARDGFKCADCNSEKMLIVHHINHWKQIKDKLQIHDVNNLRTLCRRCHLKVHNHQKKNLRI